MLNDNIAIVLNEEAKRVPTFRDDVLSFRSPRVDVLISEREADASGLMQIVCDQGYGLVIAAGGDFTAARVVDGVSKNGYRPKVGFVKLGTGNGCAHALGANDPIEDIGYMVERGVANLETTPFPLVRTRAERSDGSSVEEMCATFAGSGFDSLALHSYDNTRLRGLLGYLWAVFKALPILLGRYPYATIGEHDLTFAEEEGSIDKRLEGKLVHTVVAATTPYFGFRFKAMPLAEEAAKRGKMHVRIFTGRAIPSASRYISRTRPVWKGIYRHPSVLECYGTRVVVEHDHLLQIAGKSQGEVVRIEYSIADPIDLVDLRKR